MMITSLENVKFYAYHGLYDFEREKGGEFIVNIHVESPEKPAYTTLADVVNYEQLFAIAAKHMNTPTPFIEEVARLILDEITFAFPEILTAEVQLIKCAPPIPNMQGSAKVTLVYRKGS
ncbi:MAG: dihydroneopterin aldolase [Bacteroidota bacterium]|jgi:dihydroneopterin aldolase